MRTAVKKLTPKQTELLEAMRSGVICHFVAGMDGYYFRMDTLKRCTATVVALRARGLLDEFDATGYGRHSVRLKQEYTPEMAGV